MRGFGLRRAGVLFSVAACVAVVAGDASATYPGGPGKIAFVKFADDGNGASTDLFVVDPDGSNATNLTSTLASDVWAAAWSPDGTKLAIVELRDDLFAYETRLFSLLTMNADGSDRRRLVAISGDLPSPTWAPDGEKILLTRTTLKGYELLLVNANGSGKHVLRRLGRLSAYSPTWSPDGQTIAFVSSGVRDEAPRGIYLVDGDGSNLRHLVSARAWAVDWSPDGSELLYSSGRGLFVVRSDGTAPRRVFTRADMGEAAWSPDGERIVFSSGYFEEDAGLMQVNADGTCARQIANTSNAFGPVWQPVPLAATGGPIECTDVAVEIASMSSLSAVDDEFTIHAVVENRGNQPADDVQLEAPIPVEASFVGGTTPAGACTASPVVCDFGTLPSGDAVPVELTFRADDSGFLESWVEVRTSSDDSDPSSNTADWSQIVCDGLGTAAADVLLGSSDADVLCGLGGPDTIVGRGGDDVVLDGAGPDRIWLGDGADTLYAEAGNDVVFGGTGQDHLSGGEGDDVLSGGANGDEVSGQRGNDRLRGGAGRDHLRGGRDEDALFGGDGNDWLITYDTFRDLSDGGSGRDFAFFDRRDRVRNVEAREGPERAASAATRVSVRSRGVIADRLSDERTME